MLVRSISATDPLAGEVAELIEWLGVTGPEGVRDQFASIGDALVAPCS